MRVFIAQALVAPCASAWQRWESAGAVPAAPGVPLDSMPHAAENAQAAAVRMAAAVPLLRAMRSAAQACASLHSSAAAAAEQAVAPIVLDSQALDAMALCAWAAKLAVQSANGVREALDASRQPLAARLLAVAAQLAGLCIECCTAAAAAVSAATILPPELPGMDALAGALHHAAAAVQAVRVAVQHLLAAARSDIGDTCAPCTVHALLATARSWCFAAQRVWQRVAVPLPATALLVACHALVRGAGSAATCAHLRVAAGTWLAGVCGEDWDSLKPFMRGERASPPLLLLHARAARGAATMPPGVRPQAFCAAAGELALAQLAACTPSRARVVLYGRDCALLCMAALQALQQRMGGDDARRLAQCAVQSHALCVLVAGPSAAAVTTLRQAAARAPRRTAGDVLREVQQLQQQGARAGSALCAVRCRR